MNLMWTGTTPIYWVGLLLLVSLGTAVYAYRRQKTGGIWRIVLPFLRCAAFVFLCLCLLQPVLTRQQEKIYQGVIPVILDNSESMGVADPYLEWQKLKLAAHLNLIDVDEADAHFEKRATAWNQSLEASYKSPLWLSALAKVQSPNELNNKIEPLTKWMESVEQELEEEKQALQSERWNHSEKAKEALLTEQLKETQSILNKGMELLKQQLQAVKAKQSELRKSGVTPEAIRSISVELRKLFEEIKQQSRHWIDIQIKVGTAKSKGVEGDLKVFDRLMNSPDRLTLIKNCLSSSSVRELLEQKGDLRFYNLNDKDGEIPFKGLVDIGVDVKRTSLGSKIRSILKQYDQQPIAGILILSDGNNNAGLDLDSAKRMAEERGIQIYGAGVGGRLAPPDVSVDKVIGPKASFQGDQIRIQALIGREGFADKTLKVNLKAKDQIVDTQTIAPSRHSKSQVNFTLASENAGRQNFSIEVEYLEGDVLKENNFKNFEVNILGDKIKTLFIEEFPRWESRYAALMLERDPRIDLNAIFIASQEGGRLPIGEKAFPKDRDGLHSYDILVLGDINPRHFNSEQLENIKSFILEGGKVMIIAGSRHMPHAYLQTPLIDVLPLTLNDDSSLNANKTRSIVQEGSRFEDLLAIGNDMDETVKLWKDLPQLNWVNRKVKGAAIADVLVASEQGFPIMSRADIGAGKVLYLGTDSFWKWRNRSRWTFHHRLWSQILLWATTTRTTGRDAQVKLMTTKGTYDPDHAIDIKAKLLDENGKPRRHASASLEVMNPAGEVLRKTPLIFIEGSASEYKATLPPMPEGSYSLLPVLPDSERDLKQAKVHFEVKSLPTHERLALKYDRAKLQQLCHQVKPLEKLLELIQDIEPKSKTQMQRIDLEIWDTFPFMILVAFLLGLEWHIRKKVGLV